MKEGDPLITPGQAQAALGISKATYYRWLREGRLRGVKVGSRWRFARAHIDDLLSGGKAMAEEVEAMRTALDTYASLLVSRGFKKKEVETMRLQERTAEGQAETAVRMILEHAVRSEAEQVHLEPHSNGLQVREKIDGVLSPVADSLPSAVTAQVIRALKRRAGLDPAIQDRPLDGRFFTHVGDQNLEIRALTYPTGIGESATLWLLNPDAVNLKLTRIGLPKKTTTKILGMLSRQRGVFIVNGPTGSGKTTTLYCLLTHLRSRDRKIMTAESPVEIHLDGIQQGVVHDGMAFNEALRVMIKSDVDIAMISEVRTPETLDLIFTAAHTGHLLLTSLHCSDGIHAIQKMLEHGLSPSTLTDNLLGILDQRLLRKNCQACAARQPIRGGHARMLRLDPREKAKKVSYAKGCKKCRGTGFKGRVLVAELLSMTPSLREAILSNPDSESLRASLPEDVQGLREEVLRRVFAGEVSPVEACSALPG